MTSPAADTPTAEFETPIGICTISWSERGITAVGLPGRRRPAPRPVPANPPVVREAAEAITALLAGEPSDLSWIALDQTGIGEFDRRVAEAARAIRPGHTATYGELAATIRPPAEAREVGAALARNRTPLIVPCHRIVAANGRLGGFSAPGGRATKLRLLEIELPLAEGALALFG